jgi:alkanesulfonate monooxygenase SsuD/methylene tetrahydromethanopterin reductase-like flavin-dependent oxidoreductase (luciferase family)
VARPLRYGVNLRTTPDVDPAADARHAEDLGFDLVTVMDHLPGSRPAFETWTEMTWVAAATERILVGSNVLGMPYRHPAVTAKMAETLQGLSGGRLVLGIGGGGSNAEFAAFGLPARPPKEKVDAFEEGVEIIRRLWAGGPVTFEGEHYSVRQAEISPLPEALIPLWFGVYGPRSLRLAGRLANGWLPSYRFAPPDRWVEGRDRIRRAAEEAGRDPDAIDYAYNIGVRVDERAEQRPGMIAGPPDQVTEGLEAILELGVTFPVIWTAGEGVEQRERLAKEVLPNLRVRG